MKKLVLFLFIGFMSFAIKAQENNEVKTVEDPNAPVIEFETDILDYGKIELNSDGLRVFKFKNTGKSPLIISRVQSSCGCTVPKKPTEPILPGESAEIEVKYNTATPGGFSKMITVFSNATEATKRLRIKGIVIKPETTVN